MNRPSPLADMHFIAVNSHARLGCLKPPIHHGTKCPSPIRQHASVCRDLTMNPAYLARCRVEARPTASHPMDHAQPGLVPSVLADPPSLASNSKCSQSSNHDLGCVTTLNPSHLLALDRPIRQTVYSFSHSPGKQWGIGSSR